MLMSWNFSQCFYYRPPVLNIFQSNTPKFHCLQWINNTVLSLKYHAFFNQALGLEQKLLERYLFYDQNNYKLSRHHGGPRVHVWNMQQSQTPLGWTPRLRCSCDLNFHAASRSRWGTWEEARGCVNCRRKRAPPVFVSAFSKCSPKVVG